MKQLTLALSGLSLLVFLAFCSRETPQTTAAVVTAEPSAAELVKRANTSSLPAVATIATRPRS